MNTVVAVSLENLLAEHSFLSGLGSQHLKTISSLAVVSHFKKGQFLCRECEEAKHFYLISQGEVAVQSPKKGKGNVNIQSIGPGEIVGWSWLVPPHHWRFNARALSAVDAIEIDGTALRKACEADAALGSEILRRLAFVLALRLEMLRLQLASANA